MVILEAAAFVLIAGVAIGWVHFSQSDEKGLIEVIPKIRSAHIRMLEVMLRMDITNHGVFTPEERRAAECRRLELIVEWLPRLDHNNLLFQSLGRCLTRKAHRKAVEDWRARDFKAFIMLRKAILCRAMLTYAKLHFAVLRRVNAVAWPLTWPVVLLSLGMCRSVVRRYKRVVILALKISAAYGDHHYENMHACL